MIVITIQFWRARTRKIETIGRMVIANTGKNNDPSRGDYVAWLARRNANHSLPPQSVVENHLKTVEIKDYPRLSYSVWVLVLRVLKKMFK